MFNLLPATWLGISPRSHQVLPIRPIRRRRHPPIAAQVEAIEVEVVDVPAHALAPVVPVPALVAEDNLLVSRG